MELYNEYLSNTAFSTVI